VSKKLEAKQRKRLAEQARRAQQRRTARRSNMVTLVVAVVVVALVALVIVRDRSSGESAVPQGTAASDAGCSGIQRFDQVSREHIEVGTEHEPYNSTPPTSGPHYPTPADAAFYPEALPEEQLVHNLEHGQIVIWYSPDAPSETIDSIEALVDDADDTAPVLLAAPYSKLEGEATYAITAWTALQTCRDYSKEVIDDFRTRFQGRGPEQVGVPPFSG
jgi:Protein of unknown function (DUF3105)